MKIKQHIPNCITCMNLVSGCIAVVMALMGDLLLALVWVVAAAVFDFFDGFAARALHAYSSIGKELDSLADQVSFGVAPGMVLFALLSAACRNLDAGGIESYIPFLAFVIPAFSGLRLAKFNVDTRQATSFIGLPVPAHALLWTSLGCTILPFAETGGWLFVILTVIAAMFTSFLLVSEVPMFSMKIKSLTWKGNELRYILVAGSACFIIFFGVPGIAASMILYILLSLVNKQK